MGAVFEVLGGMRMLTKDELNALALAGAAVGFCVALYQYPGCAAMEARRVHGRCSQVMPGVGRT
jgi:hypothetical protein